MQVHQILQQPPDNNVNIISEHAVVSALIKTYSPQHAECLKLKVKPTT